MLIIRNILEKERARERETLLGDTVRLNSKAGDQEGREEEEEEEVY